MPFGQWKDGDWSLSQDFRPATAPAGPGQRGDGLPTVLPSVLAGAKPGLSTSTPSASLRALGANHRLKVAKLASERSQQSNLSVVSTACSSTACSSTASLSTSASSRRPATAQLNANHDTLCMRADKSLRSWGKEPIDGMPEDLKRYAVPEPSTHWRTSTFLGTSSSRPGSAESMGTSSSGSLPEDQGASFSFQDENDRPAWVGLRRKTAVRRKSRRRRSEKPRVEVAGDSKEGDDRIGVDAALERLACSNFTPAAIQDLLKKVTASMRQSLDASDGFFMRRERQDKVELTQAYFDACFMFGDLTDRIRDITARIDEVNEQFFNIPKPRGRRGLAEDAEDPDHAATESDEWEMQAKRSRRRRRVRRGSADDDDDPAEVDEPAVDKMRTIKVGKDGQKLMITAAQRQVLVGDLETIVEDLGNFNWEALAWDFKHWLKTQSATEVGMQDFLDQIAIQESSILSLLSVSRCLVEEALGMRLLTTSDALSNFHERILAAMAHVHALKVKAGKNEGDPFGYHQHFLAQTSSAKLAVLREERDRRIRQVEVNRSIYKNMLAAAQGVDSRGQTTPSAATVEVMPELGSDSAGPSGSSLEASGGTPIQSSEADILEPVKTKAPNSRLHVRAIFDRCITRARQYVSDLATSSQEKRGLVDRMRRNFRVQQLQTLREEALQEEERAENGAAAAPALPSPTGAGLGAPELDPELAKEARALARALLAMQPKRKARHSEMDIQWLIDRRHRLWDDLNELGVPVSAAMFADGFESADKALTKIVQASDKWAKALVAKSVTPGDLHLLPTLDDLQRMEALSSPKSPQRRQVGQSGDEGWRELWLPMQSSQEDQWKAKLDEKEAVLKMLEAQAQALTDKVCKDFGERAWIYVPQAAHPGKGGVAHFLLDPYSLIVDCIVGRLVDMEELAPQDLLGEAQALQQELRSERRSKEFQAVQFPTAPYEGADLQAQARQSAGALLKRLRAFFYGVPEALMPEDLSEAINQEEIMANIDPVIRERLSEAKATVQATVEELEDEKVETEVVMSEKTQWQALEAKYVEVEQRRKTLAKTQADHQRVTMEVQKVMAVRKEIQVALLKTMVGMGSAGASSRVGSKSTVGVAVGEDALGAGDAHGQAPSRRTSRRRSSIAGGAAAAAADLHAGAAAVGGGHHGAARLSGAAVLPDSVHAALFGKAGMSGRRLSQDAPDAAGPFTVVGVAKSKATARGRRAAFQADEADAPKLGAGLVVDPQQAAAQKQKDQMAVLARRLTKRGGRPGELDDQRIEEMIRNALAQTKVLEVRSERKRQEFTSLYNKVNKQQASTQGGTKKGKAPLRGLRKGPEQEMAELDTQLKNITRMEEFWKSRFTQWHNEILHFHGEGVLEMLQDPERIATVLALPATQRVKAPGRWAAPKPDLAEEAAERTPRPKKEPVRRVFKPVGAVLPMEPPMEPLQSESDAFGFWEPKALKRGKQSPKTGRASPAPSAHPHVANLNLAMPFELEEERLDLPRLGAAYNRHLQERYARGSVSIRAPRREVAHSLEALEGHPKKVRLSLAGGYLHPTSIMPTLQIPLLQPKQGSPRVGHRGPSREAAQQADGFTIKNWHNASKEGPRTIIEEEEDSEAAAEQGAVRAKVVDLLNDSVFKVAAQARASVRSFELDAEYGDSFDTGQPGARAAAWRGPKRLAASRLHFKAGGRRRMQATDLSDPFGLELLSAGASSTRARRRSPVRRLLRTRSPRRLDDADPEAAKQRSLRPQWDKVRFGTDSISLLRMFMADVERAQELYMQEEAGPGTPGHRTGALRRGALLPDVAEPSRHDNQSSAPMTRSGSSSSCGHTDDEGEADVWSERTLKERTLCKLRTWRKRLLRRFGSPAVAYNKCVPAVTGMTEDVFLHMANNHGYNDRDAADMFTSLKPLIPRVRRILSAKRPTKLFLARTKSEEFCFSRADFASALCNMEPVTSLPELRARLRRFFANMEVAFDACDDGKTGAVEAVAFRDFVVELGVRGAEAGALFREMAVHNERAPAEGGVDGPVTKRAFVVSLLHAEGLIAATRLRATLASLVAPDGAGWGRGGATHAGGVGPALGPDREPNGGGWERGGGEAAAGGGGLETTAGALSAGAPPAIAALPGLAAQEDGAGGTVVAAGVHSAPLVAEHREVDAREQMKEMYLAFMSHVGAKFPPSRLVGVQDFCAAVQPLGVHPDDAALLFRLADSFGPEGKVRLQDVLLRVLGGFGRWHTELQDYLGVKPFRARSRLRSQLQGFFADIPWRLRAIRGVRRIAKIAYHGRGGARRPDVFLYVGRRPEPDEERSPRRGRRAIAFVAAAIRRASKDEADAVRAAQAAAARAAATAAWAARIAARRQLLEMHDRAGISTATVPMPSMQKVEVADAPDVASGAEADTEDAAKASASDADEGKRPRKTVMFAHDDPSADKAVAVEAAGASAKSPGGEQSVPSTLEGKKAGPGDLAGTGRPAEAAAAAEGLADQWVKRSRDRPGSRGSLFSRVVKQRAQESSGPRRALDSPVPRAEASAPIGESDPPPSQPTGSGGGPPGRYRSLADPPASALPDKPAEVPPTPASRAAELTLPEAPAGVTAEKKGEGHLDAAPSAAAREPSVATDQDGSPAAKSLARAAAAELGEQRRAPEPAVVEPQGAQPVEVSALRSQPRLGVVPFPRRPVPLATGLKQFVGDRAGGSFIARSPRADVPGGRLPALKPDLKGAEKTPDASPRLAAARPTAPASVSAALATALRSDGALDTSLRKVTATAHRERAAALLSAQAPPAKTDARVGAGVPGSLGANAGGGRTLRSWAQGAGLPGSAAGGRPSTAAAAGAAAGGPGRPAGDLLPAKASRPNTAAAMGVEAIISNRFTGQAALAPMARTL